MTTPEKAAEAPAGGLSVCIPVYNKAPLLERLLASLQRQNISPLEVVAVNNGSTDGSLQILEAWRDRLNLKIFSTPRTISLPDNWLLALSLGTQEFLKLQLADDLIPAGALQPLLDVIRRKPDIGFVCGNTHPIDEKGEIITRGHLHDYHARCNEIRRQMPAAKTFREKARCLEKAGIRFSPLGDANPLVFRASLLPHLRHGVNKLGAAFLTWPEYEIFVRLFAAADAGYLDIPASHLWCDDGSPVKQNPAPRHRRWDDEIGGANLLPLLMLDPDLKPLTSQFRKRYFAKHFLLQFRRIVFRKN